MKVTLVKRDGIPISIGAGKYVFALVDGKVIHNEESRNGSEFFGHLDEYNQAFELAELAVQLQEFDIIENHVGESFMIKKNYRDIG